MQRQIRYEDPRIVDPFTIQGQVDIALKELNPANNFRTTISSR